MTHAQLVTVSKDPEFQLALSLIFSALTCRLECNQEGSEVEFNLNPRVNYRGQITVNTIAPKKLDPAAMMATIGSQPGSYSVSHGSAHKPGQIFKAVNKPAPPQPKENLRAVSPQAMKRENYSNNYQTMFGEERNRMTQIPNKKANQTLVHPPN